MIRLSAWAKINWFLEITGRRPDGYHTLSTIFQTISLGDTLTLSSSADLTLTCSDSRLPTDERNLVMRAAVRLREVLNERRGAAIHLRKVVPMGAGLGGGSADAAATLRGLLKLWKRSLPKRVLKDVAVKLGADVPFFLIGGRCAATGIGDRLKRLKPLRKTWLVIVWPGFGVSTRDAYSKVVIPAKAGIHQWTPASAGVTQSLFNRFESLVFPDHPELPRLKRALLAAGAQAALMSGSGSSVFGVARSQADGTRLLSVIKKKYPHAWLVHTL